MRGAGRCSGAVLGLALLGLTCSNANLTRAGESGSSVTVTVSAPDAVAGGRWPVTFGVPFPRSQVRTADTIRVTGEDGLRMPVQSRVLARWEDGSLRWVLLDSQASVAAGTTARLQVSTDSASAKSPAAPPVDPLRVTENGDSYSVTTGNLSFAVAKRHFGPVENLQAGEARVPGPMRSFLGIDGKRLSAGSPRRVKVLEHGSLRALIEIEGEYGHGFDYLTRVEAYAGQPFIRLWHTFVDRSPKPYVTLHEATLELALPTADAARYRIGVTGGAERRGRLGGEGVSAYQMDNETYDIGGKPQPGKLAGWTEWSGGKTTLGLAGRWFWQEYPKSFVLETGRLAYQLWPSASSPTRMGMGSAKTHELVLWVTSHGRDTGADDFPASPLVAAVDPAWIERTRALPNTISNAGEAGAFIDRARSALQRYRQRQDTERWDDRGTVNCPPESPARPRRGAYGMWNWGDWNFRGYHDNTKGCDAWGNQEYDTTQVLALLFAVTGDATARDDLDAAARHFMDVDTIHFHDRHPQWAGMNHPKNPLHFSFELGGVDSGHTWTEGLISYHWLTGDDRALAAARGIADYLAGRVRGMRSGNPRQWGWPAIALLAAHDATGEQEYLAGAVEYAHGAMRAYAEPSVEHWKSGVLADALAYVHARTRDPEIERWLLQFARQVVQREKKDARFYPAVAYVASLRRDESLGRAARERVRKIDLGSWGKPFTSGGRLGFRIHSLLQAAETAAGRSPTPAGAGAR